MHRALFGLAFWVLILLMAQSASAQTWTRDCQTGTTTQSLATGGSFACFDIPASSTTVSVMLNVSACENFDVFFDPDINGAGTTATVDIFSCVANETTNSCQRPYNNTAEDLNDNAFETLAIFGAAGVWIFADPVLAPGGGETARVLVHCNL